MMLDVNVMLDEKYKNNLWKRDVLICLRIPMFQRRLMALRVSTGDSASHEWMLHGSVQNDPWRSISANEHLWIHSRCAVDPLRYHNMYPYVSIIWCWRWQSMCGPGTSRCRRHGRHGRHLKAEKGGGHLLKKYQQYQPFGSISAYFFWGSIF
jgi:hypothetical protein